MDNTENLTPDQQDILDQINEGQHLIPEHMWSGVVNYFVHRLPPGAFMTAILSNDFMDAAGRADWLNKAALANWAEFLYNYVPRNSYGSPEAVAAWLEARTQA